MLGPEAASLAAKACCSSFTFASVAAEASCIASICAFNSAYSALAGGFLRVLRGRPAFAAGAAETGAAASNAASAPEAACTPGHKLSSGDIFWMPGNAATHQPHGLFGGRGLLAGRSGCCSCVAYRQLG